MFKPGVYHRQGPSLVMSWRGQANTSAHALSASQPYNYFVRLTPPGSCNTARGGWLDPLRAHKDLHLVRTTKLAWRTNVWLSGNGGTARLYPLSHHFWQTVVVASGRTAVRWTGCWAAFLIERSCWLHRCRHSRV